jgi:hypothetical protein
VIEGAFGAAVILGVVVLIRDVIVLGYLPAPFFHDKSDSFMDWYNPAYWAHNPGAYSEWFSVYPPFSFLFLDLFTRPSCYDTAGAPGRDCDPVGIYVISAFLILNVVLLVLTYWKADKATAWPRAIAVGLGTSMLFGWERGNLILPCFTCFVLGYGNIIRNAWIRVVFAAVTVNFKPYLILAAAGRFLKRDWVWTERFAIACTLIYVASYALYGAGAPGELIRDTKGFTEVPVAIGYDFFEFSTTYSSLLTVLKSSFPIVHFVGSRPIEEMEFVVPLLMRGATAGVVLCLVGALWRPAALSRSRIAALVLVALFANIASQGGYSLVFLLYFVFLERWRGFGRILALVAAYLWCFQLDIGVTGITYSTNYSFLTKRMVDADMPLTLGQLTRPLLVLLMDYGLVIASLGDILSRAGIPSIHRGRMPSVGGPAGPPMSPDVEPAG